MEFYAIYDLDDNIITIFDTLDELANALNLRKRQIKYSFKNREYIYYQYKGTYRKIYKIT